jgi:hypothetical protein
VVVTRDARTDHVLPDMSSATIARHHVVQGELICSTAAVQTGVVVPQEDLLARQPLLEKWPLDHVHQPYHRRHWNETIRGVYLTTAVFQEFSFPDTSQDNRAPHGTHIEWLIVLVQHKDWRTNHLGTNLGIISLLAVYLGLQYIQGYLEVVWNKAKGLTRNGAANIQEHWYKGRLYHCRIEFLLYA